jgi:uncharacterized membrane protein YhaH (DUF805 family)
LYSNEGKRLVSGTLGKLIVWTAAMALGVAWQTYDLATATEVPNRVVAIMSYTFLAGMLIGLVIGVIGLVGSAVKYLSAGSDPGAVSPASPIGPGYVPQGLRGFYLLPRGRISRSQYWLKWAIPVVVITLLLRVATVAGTRTGEFALATTLVDVTLVFHFAILWPGFSVLSKRIHDRNKPGWLAAVFYAPIILFTIVARFFLNPVNPSPASAVFALAMLIAIFAVFLYFIVEFGFFRGTVGPNRYGPDPVRQPRPPGEGGNAVPSQ